ncbi:hypothetical protein PsorP6_009511 [Peronosclerospora sorghi]|uniref:Uncharacterized protein n=1 Tax=Peronosclerospora sorghi TaxID=230839 RepID=A0ACC0W2U6_9STRA|nr:hypothetical protein PsorP6_009511 [Peronosclerospora sorghi]
MDLSAWETEVADIRANTNEPRSRNVYLNSTQKLLEWLFMNKQHLLTKQFKDAIQRLQQTGLSLTGSVRKVLMGSSELPLIKFDELTAKDFMTWIVSLTKKDGERPGYSTFNSHRAALFNLFRDHGRAMSRTLETELQNHYRGLKRRTAVAISGDDDDSQRVKRQPSSKVNLDEERKPNDDDEDEATRQVFWRSSVNSVEGADLSEPISF